MGERGLKLTHCACTLLSAKAGPATAALGRLASASGPSECAPVVWNTGQPPPDNEPRICHAHL
eukprot:11408339-Alexandrium_andersonii.AAC.1